MKTIFFAALLVTLVGCGGGTVTLNQLENTNGKTPPGPLLEKLEEAVKTGNLPDITDRLKAITGPASERFDWKRFWSELAVRNFREALLKTHKKQLLYLHALDCESYPTFARFLVSVSTGTEYAVSTERKCNTRIEPNVVIQIAKKEEALALGSDRLEKIERTLQFLKLEILDGGYSAAWIAELQSSLPFVEKLGLEASRGGKFSTYLDVLIAGEKHGLMALPLNQLAAQIISKPANRELWFTRFGFVEGARRFHLHLGLTPNGMQVLTAAEQDRLNDRLTLEIESADPDRLATVYSVAAALSRSVHSQKRETARKLAAFDKLLLAAETKWFDQSEGFRHEKLSLSAKELNGTAASRELVILAGRTHNRHPIWPSNAVVQDEIDTVLSLSQDLANAKTTGQKKAAKAAFCDFLEAKDIIGETLTQAELGAYFTGYLPAGCYVMEKEGNAFHYAQRKPITASFASLIEADDTNFEVEAPAIRLGAVYLCTTEVPAKRVATPTPQSANAVTLPVLIGVEVPEKTVRLKKGSHFFLFHLTLKKTAAGETEPQAALPGFEGPSLLLHIVNQTKAQVFLSVPGEGQAEAAPRPGGLGDKSTVDFEQVNEWLDALSSLDKLTVMRPLTLHSEVDINTLEDMLTNATKTSDSKIKIFTIPGYIHQLPDAEKAQVIAACEQHFGRKVEPQDLDDYYKNMLAPKAAQQANSLLDQSKEDGLYLRTDALPEFMAKDVYRVEGGATGPRNPQGPEGKPGTLEVRVQTKQ